MLKNVKNLQGLGWVALKTKKNQKYTKIFHTCIQLPPKQVFKRPSLQEVSGLVFFPKSDSGKISIFFILKSKTKRSHQLNYYRWTEAMSIVKLNTDILNINVKY